ncbi:MAG: hypothetical protein NTW25_02295 [Candidatus Kapabacteria bacterium]|nr:hypothetical protein [Candidatus Kapabacteria bacterium]
MANQKVAYGHGIVDFFPIALNTGGTAYEILDGSDVAVSAPTTSNKAYRNTLIGSTKPAFQEDGTVKLSWNNYDGGEDFNTFLNRFAVPATSAGTTLPDVQLETGVLETGASATSKLVLAIAYLHQEKLSSATKRMCVVAVGTVSPTSGSFETSGTDYSKPTLEFTSIKVKVACTVDKDIFDSAVVTVGADKSIAISKGFLREFLTAA